MLDGELTGLDMDVLRAVTEEMGVTNIVWYPFTFSDLIPCLDNGYYDVGMAALTPTADRQKVVLFSDPYIDVKQMVVVLAGSDYTIEDLKDLTIATMSDSTSTDAAKKYCDNIIGFPTEEEAIEAVLDGRAQAAVVDSITATWSINSNPELKSLDILDDKESYSFAFNMDNEDLRDRFNAALNAVKESGLLDKILQYYEDNGYREVPSYFDQ